MKEVKVLICDCSNAEHQMLVRHCAEDKEAYVNIYLKPHGFWKRVKKAIQYVMGHRCNYGDFQEIILNADHAKFFADLALELAKYNVKSKERIIEKLEDKIEKLQDQIINP